jgi:hypothetical protein
MALLSSRCHILQSDPQGRTSRSCRSWLTRLPVLFATLRPSAEAPVAICTPQAPTPPLLQYSYFLCATFASALGLCARKTQSNG